VRCIAENVTMEWYQTLYIVESLIQQRTSLIEDKFFIKPDFISICSSVYLTFRCVKEPQHHTDQNGLLRDDFYQYDPVSDQFTQLDDFPGGARSFAIGDTWNGKAYFGFGSNDTQLLGDLWEFDPVTQAWTELATCPCTPRRHPALIAHNGKVFVGLGGSITGDRNDWWIYDIPTDTWTEAAEFPSLRRHHPYQFAIDDYVYVH